ncbi:hypothetical protein D3C73_858890 [compost metagenome]
MVIGDGASTVIGVGAAATGALNTTVTCLRSPPVSTFDALCQVRAPCRAASSSRALPLLLSISTAVTTPLCQTSTCRVTMLSAWTGARSGMPWRRSLNPAAGRSTSTCPYSAGGDGDGSSGDVRSARPLRSTSIPAGGIARCACLATSAFEVAGGEGSETTGPAGPAAVPVVSGVSPLPAFGCRSSSPSSSVARAFRISMRSSDALASSVESMNTSLPSSSVFTSNRAGSAEATLSPRSISPAITSAPSASSSSVSTIVDA